MGTVTKSLASKAPRFFFVTTVAVLCLLLVPTERQVFSSGIPYISNWANVATLFLVALLLISLVSFAGFQLNARRKVRKVRTNHEFIVLIVLVATVASVVVDALIRFDPVAANFVLNLALLLGGLALAIFYRAPVLLTSQSTIAIVILFSIAGNWIYQAVVGISYVESADIGFAHTLALSLPFLLLVGGKNDNFSLVLLTHSTSWIAFLFLLQTQLRGPAFIAGTIVTIQSFWLASPLPTRFLASTAQLGAAVTAWQLVVYRILLDTQGKLYLSGREKFFDAILETRDITLGSLLWGEGPGGVRNAIAATFSGYNNPHSSWLVLIGDYGLLRGGLVLTALILAAAVAGMGAINSREDKLRLRCSRFAQIGALLALGVVAEPVETISVVLVILALLVWTPGANTDWQRTSPTAGSDQDYWNLPKV